VQVTLDGAPQPAARRSSWVAKAAPVACGCALAAAAVYVALNDPADSTAFPACPLYQTTGIWCAACGLTRGTHQLLNGNIGAALGSNLFVPVVLAAIVAGWWGWTRSAFGGRGISMKPRTVQVLATVVPLVAVVFTVLRNLPTAPFSSLAP